MEKIIVVKDLVKRYKDLVAINHLDLEVRKGDIYGLLGPNGSGKTTVINCILGILKYDQGEVFLFDKKMTPTSYDIRSKIGIVPQEISLLDELTVYENIDFFCGLYISDNKIRKNLVEEAIEFTGLEDFRKFRPKKLSGGLKRRLNIACGIAHKPELIFLDEPTVAVDAQSRNNILQGIKELVKNGTTVVYTSHYMDEVEQICNHITIMDKGKNIITGTTEELKNSINIGEKIEIEILNTDKDVISLLSKESYVKCLTMNNGTLHIEVGHEKRSLTYILKLLELENIAYGKVVSHEPTLNDVFLSITGKELRDRA